MTNREAFNKYLREQVEKRIAYYEGLSDAELTEGEFLVNVNVHRELCYFKVTSTGKSIGSSDDVTKWLASERTEAENNRLMVKE